MPASASLRLTIPAFGGVFPNDTRGFSMGFANDDSLVTLVAVNVTLPFTADFAETNTFSNGWTVGVVYSFTGGGASA